MLEIEHLTGPMAPSSVSSRTFSIADFEGSRGGGLTRVACSAIVANRRFEGGRPCSDFWDDLALV